MNFRLEQRIGNVKKRTYGDRMKTRKESITKIKALAALYFHFQK